MVYSLEVQVCAFSAGNTPLVHVCAFSAGNTTITRQSSVAEAVAVAVAVAIALQNESPKPDTQYVGARINLVSPFNNLVSILVKGK